MNIKLITQKSLFILALIFSIQSPSLAQQKQIAITIDDLPFVGEYKNFHLKKIMNIMIDKQVPATGFIIAHEVRPSNWETLQSFKEAGFGLGNHTFTHANLNKIKTKEYMYEIKKADKILSPVMSEPKYFRYPYLAMGTGNKRNRILCYLEKKHYQVAPITIDSKDFAFNQHLLSVPEIDRRGYLEELKAFYLEYIWQQTLKAEERHNNSQAQILLIHANLLNAYVLQDIIKLYRKQGYTFVSLEDALKTFKTTMHCTEQMQVALKEQRKKLSINDFVDWD